MAHTEAAKLLISMEFTGYCYPDGGEAQAGLVKYRFIEYRQDPDAPAETKLHLTPKGVREISILKSIPQPKRAMESNGEQWRAKRKL